MAVAGTEQRILVADDDPVSRYLVTQVLRRSGYTVVAVEDGAQAWAAADGPDAPRILLLDLMMPHLTGLEVCRRVRARGDRRRVHVLLMTAKNRHADMLEGFAAGADDFLTKPLDGPELLARVQAAARALDGDDGPIGLSEAIAEARVSPGGDLLVRSGAEVGRVMFHAGRVAWIHLSHAPGSLYDLLAGRPEVAREDITAVLDECFTAGRHFADVLVEWGLIPASELSALLREWLAAKLRLVLSERYELAMFVPLQRSYASPMTFTIDELTPAAAAAAGSLAPTTMPPPGEAAAPEGESLLDEAMTFEGAQAAALLDSARGVVLARRGSPRDEALMLALTRVLRGEGVDERVDDILVTRGSRLHLLHRTPDGARHVYLEIERADTNLGLARGQLQALVRRRWPG
jgi:CheY-like chemotaxis protein